MRLLMNVTMPPEPFHSAVRHGYSARNWNASLTPRNTFWKIISQKREKH